MNDGVNLETSMITGVNWCMRSYPNLCTDHDNSMHIVISVSALALTVIVSLTAMCAFHQQFEKICVDRVSNLCNHKSGVFGVVDNIYSKESRQFLREHQELKPHGWTRA